MNKGAIFPPVWKMLTLPHFLLLLLRAGAIASDCDNACLGHPLLRIGLPLLNETAVSYWWPGQDVEFVHFEGNGLAMTPHVPQVKRNRWHKLVLQSSFSPEDEFMMQHRGKRLGGWYKISIPTLDISVNVSCEGLSCKNVIASSLQPMTWAVGCGNTPCGCPREAAEDCARGEVQKTDCEILYLNQAGVVLNSPSKVFWRPLLAHSKLHLFLGPTSNLSAKAYTLNSSRDALHTWLTFHIQSWVVEIGNETARDCNVTVPFLNFSTQCPVDNSADTAMVFDSADPFVIALGCDEPPVYRKTTEVGLSGWVFFAVVPIFILVCVPVLCVTRRKRRTRRQGFA